MLRVPARVQHPPRVGVTHLKWLRFWAFPLVLFGGLAAAGAFLAGLVLALAYPNLPSLDVLTDYQPKIPLRVYTVEGALIGEFGEERRLLVSIREVPEQVKQAILAAEDERFYQHTLHPDLRIASPIANLTDGEVLTALLNHVPRPYQEFSSCGASTYRSKHCGEFATPFLVLKQSCIIFVLKFVFKRRIGIALLNHFLHFFQRLGRGHGAI